MVGQPGHDNSESEYLVEWPIDPVLLFSVMVLVTLFLSVAMAQRRIIERLLVCILPLVLTSIIVYLTSAREQSMQLQRLLASDLAVLLPVAAGVVLFLVYYQGKGRDFARLIAYLAILGVLWTKPFFSLQQVLLHHGSVDDRAVIAGLSSMAALISLCVPLTEQNVSRERLLELLLPLRTGFWRHADVIISATVIFSFIHATWYIFQGQPIRIHVTTPLSLFLVELSVKVVFFLLPIMSIAFVAPSILFSRVTSLVVRSKTARISLHAVLYVVGTGTMGFDSNVFIIGTALVYSWLYISTGTIFWSFVLLSISFFFSG